MKYFIYCILSFASLLLFLPEAGDTKIRNLPLLLAILFVVCLYFIYRFLNLVSLVHNVERELKRKDIKIKKTRLRFQKGYILAENERCVFDIYLLIRRKSYYRYHFENANSIEFFKTSSAVSKSNTKGTVARGAAYSRLVGKQKISRHFYESNKVVDYLLVMDKFPNSITDSTKKEELDNGDKICSSGVVLYNLAGFTRYIENK